MPERLLICVNCNQSPVPLEEDGVKDLATSLVGTFVNIKCNICQSVQTFCVSRVGDVFCLPPDITADSVSHLCAFRKTIRREISAGLINIS